MSSHSAKPWGRSPQMPTALCWPLHVSLGPTRMQTSAPPPKSFRIWRRTSAFAASTMQTPRRPPLRLRRWHQGYPECARTRQVGNFLRFIVRRQHVIVTIYERSILRGSKCALPSLPPPASHQRGPAGLYSRTSLETPSSTVAGAESRLVRA